jgi:hypothetical protein
MHLNKKDRLLRHPVKILVQQVPPLQKKKIKNINFDIFF